MAAIPHDPGPVTERYPGEALALLRKVSADLDHLRAIIAPLQPVAEAMRTGGLLAARRAWNRIGGGQ
jgi:hypothetical protein